MPELWIPDDPADVGLDGAALPVRRYPPGGSPSSPSSGDLLVTPYAQRDLARATVAALPPGIVVQALESGVDWALDVLPDGVGLCNARGVHDGPVAEWVLAAILGSLKRLNEFRDHQREDVWGRELPDGLAGKTVLIVGYGSIGQAVERRLAPFDVEILRVARRARDGVEPTERLPELLPRADVVVLLAPLTERTAGMVDRAFLSALRDSALIVNAARGGLVDTDALVAELHAGRLRAALDVTDPEPLPAGHPLWSAPRVLLTPHVASDTPDVLRRLYGLVAEQAARLARGEPPINHVRPPIPAAGRP